MQTILSQEDDPNFHAVSVLQQYHQAWLGAREAKQKGDKTSQKHFGNIINKLKKELSLLGFVPYSRVSG